jgi:hypothetical protein
MGPLHTALGVIGTSLSWVMVPLKGHWDLFKLETDVSRMVLGPLWNHPFFDVFLGLMGVNNASYTLAGDMSHPKIGLMKALDGFTKDSRLRGMVSGSSWGRLPWG